MADNLKLVRVFLASPSDLQLERQTVKNVVEEINTLWAEQTGYRIELVGWEDTVSEFGRPQELINRDLERCEFFLGMLWKRWGTPPSADGPYSSGFEEEFRRSLDRRNSSGRPEMSLFFKDIPSDALSDPGADLQKVLNFKKEITEVRLLLYEGFSEQEFAGK